MNYKLIFNTVFKVIKAEAILMLIPLVTSAIYNEQASFIAFAITIVASFLIALLLSWLLKPKYNQFYAKEGFVTVALTWIFVSLIGCVPFVISGEIPNFIDAFFETVSGFTTTGASILENVESLSKGMLMWRSFSHFIGGMGVLVFIMAITSKTTDRPIHILRAEMPGPIKSKLVPSSKDTAKILYLIYIAITAVLIVLLVLGGMPLYESIIHAFGTAGTGGFGITNDSVASYSDYIQWVIAIFMFIFGINFNLFYLVIIKKFSAIFKSSELRAYILIIVTAVIIICLDTYKLYNDFATTIKNSFFQTTSIITTTGFSSVDFNNWPNLSKTILFILMFIGGCAGSTAGGLKVSRVVLTFKRIGSSIKRLLHPNAVSVIKYDNESVDKKVSFGLADYLLMYASCFFVLTLLLSFNGLDFETTITSVASCFNNVGPGFNQAYQNYNCYNDFSKIILSLTMLLGRLEVYPLLIALIPSTWAKK